MRQFILLWFFTVVLSVNVTAQGSNNKKAIKLVEKAEIEIKSRLFYDALDNLKKAIAKDPNYVDAYQKLANLYTFLRIPDSAYTYYRRYYDLADKELLSAKAFRALSVRFYNEGEYGVAAEAFRFYLQKKPGSSMDYRDSVYNGSLNFSFQALENPRNLVVKKLDNAINQFALQYFPVLTIDNNHIYYTRRFGHAPHYDEDIVMSEKVNGAWTKSRSISRNINTEYNEGACSISADGRTLIFTACEGRKSFGNCDLFISEFVGEDWTRPENMGGTVNSAYWDSQPSISADGRTIFFASNRPGGFGKRDIWVTKLDSAAWTSPQNLGNTINTPYDETTPFIHVNGETLFFASEGHISLGGFDIYKSERSDENWSTVENLGSPINDFNDQSAMYIVGDGKKAYFTSDERDRSFIYSFDLQNDSLVKRKATYLTGIVSSKIEDEPLSADIVLYDLDSQEPLYRTSSDAQTGRYFLSLKADGAYGIYISAQGYLFEDSSIDLKSRYDLSPDTLNVKLSQIQLGQKVVLDNIYFEFDSYELLPSSQSELNEIALFLKNNPITVEIGGHTDTVGSEDYNQRLSENRAKAVYDGLLALSVSEEQLSYVGYGSKKPINGDADSVKNKLNRRIEFKIINKLED